MQSRCEGTAVTAPLAGLTIPDLTRLLPGPAFELGRPTAEIDQLLADGVVREAQ
jgi:hypothetical protein